MHLCTVEVFINPFLQCVFSVAAAGMWVNMCVCLTCECPMRQPGVGG